MGPPYSTMVRVLFAATAIHELLIAVLKVSRPTHMLKAWSRDLPDRGQNKWAFLLWPQ
jgi:hypothetical protein